MKTILFSFLLATLGFATPLKHVAVFETMADADSVLNEPELRYLTNELRKQAVAELPTEHYSVLTRDNIMSLLPPDKNAAECFEGQCLVEVGRNIGADYAVQGTVSKFGALLTLTVEAYDTRSGKLLTSFTGESQTVEGFLGTIREKSAQMFDAILKMDGYTRAPVAKAELPPSPSAPVSIPTGIETKPESKSSLGWLPWSLDVLGVAALGFGVWQEFETSSAMDRYNKKGQSAAYYKKAKDDANSASTLRNVGYIAGGVLLATGITLHFVF
jgi:TolB-like protein